jgi:hypothetical protein
MPEFQKVNEVAGSFEFSHVTYFRHSNLPSPIYVSLYYEKCTYYTIELRTAKVAIIQQRGNKIKYLLSSGLVLRIARHRAGWVHAETAETERVSSVSGTLCETAVGAGGQGWCDGVVVVVVMMRPSAAMREARGVSLCQNSQNRVGELSYGHAA